MISINNINRIISITNHVFVSVFVISLFFNIFYSYTRFTPDIVSVENRSLTKCPDVIKEKDSTIKQYLKKILQYPKDVDNCFNDNFGLRNTIIAETNIQRLNLFDIVTSKEVIKGSDGWFEFYDPLVKNYLENGFDDKEIVYWYEQLLARQEYFKSQNIRYYTFIVPVKMNLLKNYFPPKYTNFPETGSLKLQKYNQLQGSKLNLVVLNDALGKNPTENYYKSDFHWNLDGAYIGYTEIYNKLSKDGVKMRLISKDECKKEIIPEYGGDLAKLSGFSDTTKLTQLKDINTTHYICDERNIGFNKLVKTFGNLPNKNFVNSDKSGNLDDVIFLRDSFTIYMSPFLLPSFNQVDLIYAPSFFENNAFAIIEKQKPKAVVSFFVESNMRRGAIQNNEQIDKFWQKVKCNYIKCNVQ